MRAVSRKISCDAPLRTLNATVPLRPLSALFERHHRFGYVGYVGGVHRCGGLLPRRATARRPEQVQRGVSGGDAEPAAADIVTRSFLSARLCSAPVAAPGAARTVAAAAPPCRIRSTSLQHHRDQECGIGRRGVPVTGPTGLLDFSWIARAYRGGGASPWYCRTG